MKKAILIILGLLILLAMTVFIIGPEKIGIAIMKPQQSFKKDIRVTAPDFKLESSWAALPWIENLSNMRPEGISADTLLKKVDVFFIHPTGYLKGHHWNSQLDMNSATEENTQWMLANQASVFSDANVYAPRYRQASIFSFLEIESEDAQSALQLAYNDVARAFDHFINNYNQGKPFILASHSQGTYHSINLLKDKIDNSLLADRMVAAYIIGMSTITTDAVSSLNKIKVCTSSDQTNCLIHWATFAEGAPVDDSWSTAMVCVNPLSWTTDNTKIGASFHKGYVESSGTFNLSFTGKDIAEGVSFDPLGPPLVRHTSATCQNGRLLVQKQKIASMALGEGNYHGLDFQLFHMNIRENISKRANAYFAKLDQDQPEITTKPH